MSHPDAPTTLAKLNNFHFDKVINEDPLTHSLTLLGTFPSTDDAQERVAAIVRVEKTALDPETAGKLFAPDGLVKKVAVEESTDIVSPTTVENILLGQSEQDKILYSSPDFVILPDMKWDLTTTSSLYLVALVRNRQIRSLRDLRRQHVPLLRAIQREGERVVEEKWALGRGALRMYVHYQPSYYHFHVHIVNANAAGMMGMAVGQAHLLDDIISLLEIEPENGPAIFEKMVLTYGLGDQHGLFEAMRAASDRECGM
ncbi:hypothetical protein C0992_005884 [Termitomyces sp. T32_za158]|nr:hypothetical protein C0992_005884 [Termitomyces sp. T32_za158]